MIAMMGAALIPAHAASLIYAFTNPAGNVGSASHIYTTNGVNVTAYGWTVIGSTPVNLYGKTGGGDESGLGLVQDTVDHEIQISDFVQFDFTNAKQQGVTSAQIQMGSAGTGQPGEGWAVYGSNTLGQLGTSLFSGTDESLHNLVASTFSAYKYFSVTAVNEGGHPLANVLVSEVVLNQTGAVPEPGTFLIAGMALLGLGVTLKKKANRQA